MKTITNTLLIATLITSNLIASHACDNNNCFASFAKPAYKASTTPFTSTPIEVIASTIVNEPTFQTETINEDPFTDNSFSIETEDNLQDEIVMIQPIITDNIEEVSPREPVVNTEYEDSIQPLIVNYSTEIESINTNIFEESINEEAISPELICDQDEEKVVTCDSENQEECICV